MDYLAICSQWTADTAGNIKCGGELMVIPVDELITRFSIEQLDPTILMTMFGGGFGLVGTFYIVGICTRTVLQVIKRG